MRSMQTMFTSLRGFAFLELTIGLLIVLLLIGAILASILGIIIGFPSLRLKDDYLALATFGLGIIVYSVAKMVDRGEKNVVKSPIVDFAGSFDKGQYEK